ncbi:MAG: hypothetical protein QM743_09105 [Chitinophagaceae bacterium]
MVQGIPVGVQSGEEKLMLDELLERNKQENHDVDTANAHTMIARLARRMAMAATDYSAHENQQALIDELFACMQPEYSPFAKKIFGVLPKDDLDKWLS